MCLHDFGLPITYCTKPPGWKQAWVEQAEIDKRAFFAAGGVVQCIPRGVSGYKELTPEELQLLPTWQRQRYYAMLRGWDMILDEVEADNGEGDDELQDSE